MLHDYYKRCSYLGFLSNCGFGELKTGTDSATILISSRCRLVLCRVGICLSSK